MIALFHEHYKVRYIPRGIASWIFYLISLLIILIAPLIVGFAMGNFWVRTNFLVQTPHIYFTDRCLLRFTTINGKEKLWTCSQNFNERFLYGTELDVLPFFSIYQEDHDGDNNVDIITIVLNLPINDISGNIENLPLSKNTDAIQRVEFIPEFIYEFHNYILKLNMTAAPLIIFNRKSELLSLSNSLVGAPLCALTEGDIKFHSTESLIASPYVSYMNTYTQSPFDSINDIEDIINVPLFASKYTGRNQSIKFELYNEAIGGLSLLQDENYNRVLGEDLGALGDFTWRIKFRIQKAEIQYIPSIQEALKWAWVQYFCIAVIFQWILWCLRGFLVKMGFISSTALFHRGWVPR